MNIRMLIGCVVGYIFWRGRAVCLFVCESVAFVFGVVFVGNVVC